MQAVNWRLPFLFAHSGQDTCTPRGSRRTFRGPEVASEKSPVPPSAPGRAPVARGARRYSQLGVENHDEHGESHAHRHSVGEAEEESGEEAHEPDQLQGEKGEKS